MPLMRLNSHARFGLTWMGMRVRVAGVRSGIGREMVFGSQENGNVEELVFCQTEYLNAFERREQESIG